jgi:DNA-directed RNA polymerase subunit M/transcription elongation factor TFIIS
MSKINCNECGEMTIIESNTQEFRYKCTSCDNVYEPEGKDTIIMFKVIKDIPIGTKILNNNIATNPVNPIEKGKKCKHCGNETVRYVVQMAATEAVRSYQCFTCWK